MISRLSGRASVLLLLATMTALLAGAGCRSDPPCGLRVCDIRQPDCQQMVAAATACLREVAPITVPMNLVSQADYVRSEGEVTLTVEEQHAFDSWNAGLALWRLAPSGLTAAQANQVSAGAVGAFYSPKDKAITIIDAGWPLDSTTGVAMLVHEYTHALQDATVGLDAFGEQFAQDFDRTMGASALIEGEATVVQDRANLGLFGDEPADVPWSRVFDRWQKQSRDSARRSSVPVTLAWAHFHYPFGTPLVHAAHENGGWAGVDALYRMPPSGAREVMAGFGGTEPGGGPWAEELGEQAVPVIPAPLVYFDSDRLGAWILEQYLLRVLPPLSRPVLHLRADRLSIFEDASGVAAVSVWRLRFASVDEAAALVAALAARGEFGDVTAMRVRQIDRDVVLIAAAGFANLTLVPEDDALAFQAVPVKPAASGEAASTGLRAWSRWSGRLRCASGA